MPDFKVGERVVRTKPATQPDFWGEVGKGYTVLALNHSGDIDVFGEERFADRNSFERINLQVGDTIRLKDRKLGYTYGKGEALVGEVGEIITVCDDGDLYINFPHHENWLGRPKEVEFVYRGAIPTKVEQIFHLDVAEFPACCTANVLHSFGGTSTAFFEDEVPQEKIEEALERQIKQGMDKGIAMLTCTTNDEQTSANKALLNKGFKHTKWMNKPNHAYTKVRLWWYPLFD